MENSCEDKLANAINNLRPQEKDYSNFFTDLYVERTYSHRAKELARLFELGNNPEATLFSGQSGSGKTTELHNVKKYWRQAKERISLYFLFLPSLMEYTLKI